MAKIGTTMIETQSLTRSQDREDIRDFRHHVTAKGRSPKTLRTYGQAAEALALFLSERGMPDLENAKREHVEDYIASMWEKGNKPATVRNRYAGLCALFKWMQISDIRRDNPMERITPPTVPEQVQPDYTLDQIRILLDSIPTKTLLDLRDRAIVALLIDTGLRCQELCDINIEDIDRDARRIHIRAGKGGKGRLVGYSHDSAMVVNRYIRKRGGWDMHDPKEPLLAGRDGAAMSPNSVRLTMLRRFETAGLEFHGTHGFRRGWGQAYLDAGGDPMDLKQLAGWSSLTMLNRYVKRTAQERALRNVDQFSPMTRVTAQTTK